MQHNLKVSTEQIIFELRPNDEKSFYKLELQNQHPEKNIGFKIKSTNVDRYIVSPAQAILEPSQKTIVEIVLKLKESDRNLRSIKDKFAIFYMEIEDTVEKDEIEKHIK